MFMGCVVNWGLKTNTCSIIANHIVTVRTHPDICNTCLVKTAVPADHDMNMGITVVG